VRARRVALWAFGLLSHALFLGAVAAMALGLWTGVESGRGRVSGGWAWAANAALMAQFPLVHSWLLTRRGGRILAAGRDLGRTLSPTTFVAASSLQLLAAFLLWSPSGRVLVELPLGAPLAQGVAFALAWLMLGWTMAEAGLGIQLGYAGWRAALTGGSPWPRTFARRGLHAVVRHPIYLAFLLVLWTGSRWTLDSVLLGVAWGSYCVVGPLLKERRYLARYGEEYRRSRSGLPLVLPLRSPRPLGRRGRPRNRDANESAAQGRLADIHAATVGRGCLGHEGQSKAPARAARAAR
jgi:protein-S-isoprenylcysteine O-methyltransferase Ste14